MLYYKTMSQSFKTIHEFSSVSFGQTLLGVNNAGTAITLGPTQSGEIIVLNATSGSAVTLGAPALGLSYRFIVGVTGGHTITAPSASILGSVTAAIPTAGSVLLTTDAAKTVISTTAGSVRGDTILLVSNGGAYYVSGAVANFNALTFTN